MPVRVPLDGVQAHAHAAATLISAMPETPFGCPNALLVGALSAAAALAGRGEERSGAAWPTLTQTNTLTLTLALALALSLTVTLALALALALTVQARRGCCCARCSTSSPSGWRARRGWARYSRCGARCSGAASTRSS